MDLETKYTPHDLSQYQITDPALRNVVNRYLSGKLTRPLLLYGEPGTGKTLLGRLLLNLICPDVLPQHIMEIEVGLDGSVNVARKVDAFASTVKSNSMDYTGVLLDEVDSFTLQGMDALKPLLTKFQKIGQRVQFVLTTNHPSKLPAAVLSRCECIEVKAPLAVDLVPLAMDIAKKEGSTVEQATIEYMLRQHTNAGYLDYREFYSRLAKYL